MAANKIKGLLIDLDGVIYNDNTPIEGAVETIQWLEDSGIPFRFLTNTTMKSRESLQKKLAAMGIHVNKDCIFSAVTAAVYYVQKKQGNCHLLLLEDAQKEFEGLAEKNKKVDFVVAGDPGETVSYKMLNDAFLHLFSGARLIALQKNRFWLSDGGYQLDAGPFVALLEYAANTQATIVGKPSKAFFDMALSHLGMTAQEVAMIGDDIESDIAGAKNRDIMACLVRTGKFREKDLEKSAIKPDFIMDSISDLPQMPFF